MKLLLPLGLATLLASPTLAQTCQVYGTIKGIGNKPIIFRYMQQGKLHRDTVRAVNDRFTYVAKPSDDGKTALIVGMPYQSFWYEPGRVAVDGEATQLGRLVITGTPQNDAQTRYNQEIRWKFEQARKNQPAAKAQLEQQEKQAIWQFIKNNPNSRIAAEELYYQAIFDEQPLAEYQALLAAMTPAVRQSWQGQNAAKRLLIIQNQPQVGQPVPDFSVADTVGVKHSLTTYRGQYVLLDFWGHWCHPCIEAMPKVKAIHTQYGQKLAIIGIAMEDTGDARLWKQAIRRHSIPGLQLSELQQAKGPVISGYNVNAFPTYMLLDPQGKLVARTNDVDEITKKLADLGNL